MQSIKTKYGAAIATLCKSSSVRPALLAALIANESGGDLHAKRFEPHVLAALWEVLLGRKAAYGSIGAQDLLQFLAGAQTMVPYVAPESLPADALQRLDSLATSWGLTQIMGYEIFDFSALMPVIDVLGTPEGSLRISLLLLTQFAHRWHLDLAADAAELLDSWNTGRPHAPTADPQYIPRGLARMTIYEGLPA